MRIAVTGSIGFVGGALVSRLRKEGHDVIRLVRPGSRPVSGSAPWDPASFSVDVDALEGAGAVVHLAGAGIGARPWTRRYKEAILRSRVGGTRLMAETVVHLSRPPGVFLSASAIGFYGDRGEEVLTEKSGSGTGFRADVCRQWEAATGAASDAGIRVAHLRFGNVLDGGGGLLGPLLPAARLGVSMQFGDGRQFLSWVSRQDAVSAVLKVVEDSSLGGGVNVTSPHPVRNLEFAEELAKALGRAPVVRIPEPLLRIGAGRERSKEVLLSSQRAVPAKLLDAGFEFRYPGLADALRTAIETLPNLQR